MTKKKGGYYDGAMQIEKGIDKLVKTVRETAGNDPESNGNTDGKK